MFRLTTVNRWLGRGPESRCRCGHRRDAHLHYRTGTDCSVCGAEVCSKFRFAMFDRG